MTSTVIRIKRKVGDDPQHALLATKRRRLDAGDAAEATAPGGSDGGAQSALLQFVGTMAPEDTVLPDAALDAVRAQRKAAAARRDPASIAAAVERAREARRERLQEEQKARRYRIVSRRRGAPDDGDDTDTAEDAGLASLPGVIDVEEEHPATTATPVTEPASTSATQEQLTCNGQVLERVSLAPAAASTSAEYVYDLYVSSAPLAEDDDLLELRPCDEVQLWDHRAARDSDSDDPFADEDDDSNDEQNWRNDYPDELGDSDYERYMDPDTGAEFDLIRRMEAHEIGGAGGAGGGDSDDEPLAYGLDELEAGGAAGDDPYDKYKARVLRQLRGDDSDDDGDAGYLADSPDGSGDEEDF